MIWRIIATGGALSFLLTGFRVLGEPGCITADLGGGSRVLLVTCRGDNDGALTRTGAGLLMCLIGVGLLIVIHWRFLRSLVTSSQYSATQSSYRSAESQSREIICKYCKKSFLTELGNCPDCFSKATPGVQDKFEKIQKTSPEKGTYVFKTLKEELELEAKVARKPATRKVAATPEFKTCPMCAEDIKFAAKKCRYCQHMLDV